MNPSIYQPSVLRTREVAVLLQCSASFVRGMAIEGDIFSVLDETGERAFHRADVDAYIEQREKENSLIPLCEAAKMLGYANASSVTYLIERGGLEAFPYRRKSKRVVRADVEALVAKRAAKKVAA